jgi:hypothetical protein
MTTTENLPALHIDSDVALPDNTQWQFRFEIHSESSNRVYVVSQHKKHRHWACSCPGYIFHRTCKHLQALGLPGHETPHEVNVIKD